jgi:hypothetical protein
MIAEWDSNIGEILEDCEDCRKRHLFICIEGCLKIAFNVVK